MKPLTTISEEIQKYVGAFAGPAPRQGDVLKEIVSAGGVDILFHEQRLYAELRDRGVRETDALRFCMMTRVTGFQELARSSVTKERVLLERYLCSALEETGLRRDVVLALTADLAVACNFAMDYRDYLASAEKNAKAAYVVPASAYERELDAFEKALNSQTEPADGGDYACLERLVEAGIPRAQYYMGLCLLEGKHYAQDTERGLALLQEAADSSCAEAAALLGDHYYARGEKDWHRAYSYYTGFGAMAQDEKRRENVTQILNRKTRNRKLLVRSAWTLALLLAMLIFTPGLGQGFLSVIAGVLCVGLYGGAIYRFRLSPYSSFKYLPVSMFALWFVCTLLRSIII